MEVYERVRILRKHMKMSQADFGKRLGVNRDVINNIENNRLAKADQKLSLYKLMCREFSVNEEWLLNGAEPMFIQADTFSLDRFITERGATDLEREVVKTYFELPFEIRQVVMEHFRQRFIGSETAVPTMAPAAEPEDGPSDYISRAAADVDIEAEVEAYRRQLENQKKAAGGRFPSGGFNGTAGGLA